MKVINLRIAIVALAIICVPLLQRAGAHDPEAPIKPTQFSGVIPILRVDSVEESIEHYTKVLGFEKHWDWPDKAANKTFASITNGKVELFLCEGGQGVPGTWIYYSVADVDALHKQYVEAKADIMEAPADKPWGMREMLVRDPDDHVLRIGTSIPPKPAEEKK